MNDELRHVGVLGRSGRYRWGSGKRPFQRLEGTTGFNREKQKKLLKETKKVRVKDLSDEELSKITARINLENSYYEARAKLKKNTSKESLVKSTAKKIATEAASLAAKNLVDSYSKYLGQKLWDYAKETENEKKREAEEAAKKAEEEAKKKEKAEEKKRKEEAKKRRKESSSTAFRGYRSNLAGLPGGH